MAEAKASRDGLKLLYPEGYTDISSNIFRNKPEPYILDRNLDKRFVFDYDFVYLGYCLGAGVPAVITQSIINTIRTKKDFPMVYPVAVQAEGQLKNIFGGNLIIDSSLKALIEDEFRGEEDCKAHIKEIFSGNKRRQFGNYFSAYLFRERNGFIRLDTALYIIDSEHMFELRKGFQRHKRYIMLDGVYKPGRQPQMDGEIPYNNFTTKEIRLLHNFLDEHIRPNINSRTLDFVH